MADAGDVRRMQRIIARVEKAGVVVRPLNGWEGVGATFAEVPVGLVDHHDASSRKSGEWGALGVIANGRPGVPKPLSQFQVARCLDDIPKLAVIAAGRANHAGRGGPLQVGGIYVPASYGNAMLYGVEKANDGLGEPMTPAAHYATDVLFYAVLAECRGEGWNRITQHKIWAAGRKSDPLYDVNWRRTRVSTFAAQAEAGDTKPVIPIPPVVPKPPSRYSEVSKATQRAVHVPVVDGLWGVQTETSVNLVRFAINGAYPLGVGETQRVCGLEGADKDGIWGPNSARALTATIKALQVAWGAGADGAWGPNTEAAWQRARAACLIT
jgi:hypothetical protein